MKQGGQHAIINWIATLFREPVYFFNNCGWNCDPYRTGRTRGVRKGTSIEDIWVNLSKLNNASDEEVERIRSVPKKCLMYSYENADVSRVYDARKPATPEKFVGSSKYKFDVLILRDFFNLSAARLMGAGNDYDGKYGAYEDEGSDFQMFDLKNYFFREKKLRRMFELSALEFLGESDYLRNKICISFNDWFLSKGYRECKAAEFGLPNNEVSVGVVAGVGNRGSRFDNFDYDGRAQEMKILERWKHFENNEMFWNLLRNEDWYRCVELSNEIFGEIPGTMKYVGSV